MKFLKNYFLLFNLMIVSGTSLQALDISSLKSTGISPLKIGIELLPSLYTLYSITKEQRTISEIISPEEVDPELEQATREVLGRFNLPYASTIPIRKMNEIGTIRYTYLSKTMIMTSKMIVINQDFCKTLKKEELEAHFALRVASYLCRTQYLASVGFIPAVTFLLMSVTSLGINKLITHLTHSSSRTVPYFVTVLKGYDWLLNFPLFRMINNRKLLGHLNEYYERRIIEKAAEAGYASPLLAIFQASAHPNAPQRISWVQPFINKDHE